MISERRRIKRHYDPLFGYIPPVVAHFIADHNIRWNILWLFAILNPDFKKRLRAHMGAFFPFGTL